MSDFDFITDEKLRASLESDHRELSIAMEHGAYKAVHVLAGSIMEAVLLYALDSANYKTKDPNKMHFGDLIETCEKEKIISERAGKLSTVVKDYRNLIHPGRMMRLEETIDEQSAEIVHALTNMIIKEVIEQQKQVYGYTANQVIEKLQRDPSATPVLRDILNQMHQREREFLMLEIPKRHKKLREEGISVAQDTPPEGISSYAIRSLSNIVDNQLLPFTRCFRIAFEMAPDETKKRIAGQFVSLIKEGSEADIFSYGETFFFGEDLKYLPDEDVTVVKNHILYRLPDLLWKDSHLCKKIGGSLTPNDEEIKQFMDGLFYLVRSINTKDPMYQTIRDYAVSEYDEMDNETSTAFFDKLSRVKETSNHVRIVNFADDVTMCIMEMDIPF